MLLLAGTPGAITNTSTPSTSAITINITASNKPSVMLNRLVLCCSGGVTSTLLVALAVPFYTMKLVYQCYY